MTEDKFHELDRRIEEHSAELTAEPIFSWVSNEPFEFYFLLTDFDTSRKYGYTLLVGHAKALGENGCPFPVDRWVEVKLPVTHHLGEFLNAFAKQVKLNSYREFKDQMFYIAYMGVAWFNDPQKGQIRIYKFNVEMIDENGNRVELQADV